MKNMSKEFDPNVYDTDKQQYWKNYDEFFRPLVGKEISLLELGVHKGGSLLLWHDYFENAIIVGLDVNPVQIDNPTGRIYVYQGLQQDAVLLDRIGQEMAPNGFDVIIDDASHVGDITRISFWHLFYHWLKFGGIYVIEDWGTGYWDVWPDGRRYKLRSSQRSESMTEAVLRRLGKGSRETLRLRSLLTKVVLRAKNRRLRLGCSNHSFGMVGFIKELVDECGMGDITDPTNGVPPYRPSKFSKMQIVHGQVFIVKNSVQ